MDKGGGSEILDIKTAMGQEKRKLLLSTRRLVVGCVKLEPGERHTTGCHDEEDEVYYILSGNGKVYLGEKEYKVKEEDIVHIPPETIHFVKNTGNVTLVYLYFGALFKKNENNF